MDWLGLLQEGEVSVQPLGSESDLSDWSEDEEEDEEEEDDEEGRRSNVYSTKASKWTIVVL